MRKSKLSHRITWRVIAIMLFFNVLIIGAILLFVFVISFVNSSSRGQYVVDGIEGKIESTLWAVQIAAANNRDEVERNLESSEKVFDALEHELYVNKYIGCFAAFEPDYFKSQGRWFEAYVYSADSTRLERRQIGSSSHDYFNSVWYEKGLNIDRQDLGYLTTPYFDNSVDSAMYCSYVLPIVDRQGRKVGVYGVDLDYLWLNEVIEEVENNVRNEFLRDEKGMQDSDAGHEAPYLQGKLLPCDSNLPVGVVADCKFSEQETVMAPGTTLFLYTDGLTEAENARCEQFGRERIDAIITSFSGSSLQLIQTMTDAVHQFVGDTEQSDDLTMLAFKINIR